MKEKWVLAILIFSIFFLIFFEPATGWRLQRLIFWRNSNQPNVEELALENESLKAEINQFQSIENKLPQSTASYLPAFVYSNYPFNFKNEILVNAGAAEGVKIGAPVVLTQSTSSTPVLIGKVEKVFQDYSLVQTILDGRFQLAVRIGSQGADSLLRGGANPILSLIPEDASISDGDAVYSATQNFPYGLAVGLVKNARNSSDQLFQEADLEIGYNPNDLQSVAILENYVAP